MALKPIPQVFDWYKNNAVAGTLLVAAFVVLKGYVIARGNLATALGMLQVAGLASVVIAGVLSSLPMLAAAFLATTVYRTVRVLIPASEAANESGGRPDGPVSWREKLNFRGRVPVYSGRWSALLCCVRFSRLCHTWSSQSFLE